MTKFIIVSGGVMSGVGKGVVTASIGKILKEYGNSVTLIKIDPYINFDAGTLRPTEHGEVWVTDDGGEIDQDLGTYERFLDQTIPKQNGITTGQVYQAVIERERNGEYLGKTVQLIPHVSDEIVARIKRAADGFDVAVIEIGGTVGDSENVPFFFAAKSLERKLGADHVAYVLVTYLPVPRHIQEMKTKPTQQAIKLLQQEGISPDFIICRSDQALDMVRKKKIEVYANIPLDHIISAADSRSIYQVPLAMEAEGFGRKLAKRLNLSDTKQPDWGTWRAAVRTIMEPTRQVRIAVVCKYLASGDYQLLDSYVSIKHALVHAGAAHGVGVQIEWVDADELSANGNCDARLADFDGVLVPGGFGNTGVDGKIESIAHARSNGVPYLGICYGLQLAVVEFARNVLGWTDAHTTEIDDATQHPVVDILPAQKEIIAEHRYGGTMRLGAYRATLAPNSLVHQLYARAGRITENRQGSAIVAERHRHRYEVNPAYTQQLEKHGLRIAGTHVRQDGTSLVEYIELPGHPFFVATQSHPEFTSRLGNPNPLFAGFVRACVMQQK